MEQVIPMTHTSDNENDDHM